MALKLNLSTRDLEFDIDKHIVIADKTEDIKQRLTLKIELMRGEWYLDKRKGIDWREIFSLSGTEQENKAKQEIKRVLENDKAVVQINELVTKQDIIKNNLSINFTVLCTDGNEYTIKLLKEE